MIGRQKAVILDVSAGATLPAFPSFTPALCVSPEAVTAATWVVFAGSCRQHGYCQCNLSYP